MKATITREEIDDPDKDMYQLYKEKGIPLTGFRVMEATPEGFNFEWEEEESSEGS